MDRKVFSCFSGGGGSSIGYKMAGFDVIGYNEIDKRMADVYDLNNSTQFRYVEPIQTLKDRDNLPEELYSLDILDGSPPCSSFSVAGNREKDWGKEKKFKEGQSLQVLDTLFFDFIALAKKLKPKIVIAENVKGLMMGSAWSYMREIYKDFEDAGYYVQHFLLDGSKMGVPQSRQRVFFIATRKDISKPFLIQKDFFTVVPDIKMEFNEPPILFKDIYQHGENERPLKGEALRLWKERIPKDDDLENVSRRLGRPNFMFNHKLIKQDKVSNTITGSDVCPLYDEPRYRSKKELCLAGTFPLDYNFGGVKPEYIIGMSVPPLMVMKVANNIKYQILDKL